MDRTLGVACVVASVFGAARLHAQQFSLVIDAQTTARPYDAKIGTRRIFICPANVEIKPIWGTDVYTEDSPICSAAVHAGVITQAQGGVVGVVIADGRATYTGSRRNDIESGTYANYPVSYTLDGTASGEIDWNTSAVGVPRGFDKPLNLACRPASLTVVGSVPAIFGTDIYSDTSPICVAALHAGIITLAGGTVGFVNRGPQQSFAATTRSGVTSRSYDAWGGSFSLIAGAPMDVAPSSAPRTATPVTTPVTAVTTPTTTTATGMTSAPPPTVAAPMATAPLAAGASPTSGVKTSPALDQGLLIGTGMSDITGPIAEIIMMGYANGDQKAAGLHTRLYARAFIFANPKTNKRVVWVSAELAMLFSSVKQGVLKQLAAKYGTLYTDENVMLSATHTHSGPGGYSHYTLYNISINGFVKPNYDGIVDGITSAIVQAHNRLAPGNVTIVSHDLVDVTMVNRSKEAFVLDEEALAVPHAPATRPEMTLLKFVSGGRPIGAIAFHAVHNTSMPNTNRLVSSDHKGYAAYLLEKAFGSVAPFTHYGDFVAAFPNGAEGDMSPNLDTTHVRDPGERPLVPVFVGPESDPFESSKLIGTREFNAAFGLFNSVQAEDIGYDVDYRHKFVLMPGTPVPSSKFTNGAGLKTLCAGAYGFSFMAGAEDGRTATLREGIALASDFDKVALDATRQAALRIVALFMPAVAPALTTLGEGFMTAASDQCQFPKPILLPTGYMHWSPEILPFQIFRVGSLAIVGVPGEMTMQAGRRLEAAVKAVLLPLGVTHVLITGLANEYSGYITTPEEFVSQQYEGASTLFGRLTFDAYTEAFRDLGVAMASGKAAGSGPPPGDLSAGQIEWIPDVDRDEVPIGERFGQILLQPPNDVVRGPNTQVQVIYRSGNPRYDSRRNDSFFKIERDAGGGNWTLVAWDGIPETRLGWSRSTVPGFGQTCPSADKCYWSTMGVVWIVPPDATPGQYRIRVFGVWKNGVTNQLVPYTGTTTTFTVH